MEFLAIEKALTKVANQPEQSGKYYQTATVFESILKSDDSPEDKASLIAKLIREGMS